MRRPRWARLLPVLAALLAVGAATLVAMAPWSSTSDARAASDVAALPVDAVAVASDAPRYASLDELQASADVVVRGQVVATERGRWFGDEASTARVQSRLVTLQVDETLVGRLDAETLVIEEEGWLADGAPLVVDGTAPSSVGDDGIWFLADGGDPVLGAYVVVGAQGRYLVTAAGEPLVGADLDDPLIGRLTKLTAEDLTTRLRAS